MFADEDSKAIIFSHSAPKNQNLIKWLRLQYDLLVLGFNRDELPTPEKIIQTTLAKDPVSINAFHSHLSMLDLHLGCSETAITDIKNSALRANDTELATFAEKNLQALFLERKIHSLYDSRIGGALLRDFYRHAFHNSIFFLFDVFCLAATERNAEKSDLASLKKRRPKKCNIGSENAEILLEQLLKNHAGYDATGTAISRTQQTLLKLIEISKCFSCFLLHRYESIILSFPKKNYATDFAHDCVITLRDFLKKMKPVNLIRETGQPGFSLARSFISASRQTTDKLKKIESSDRLLKEADSRMVFMHPVFLIDKDKLFAIYTGKRIVIPCNATFIRITQPELDGMITDHQTSCECYSASSTLANIPRHTLRVLDGCCQITHLYHEAARDIPETSAKTISQQRCSTTSLSSLSSIEDGDDEKVSPSYSDKATTTEPPAHRAAGGFLIPSPRRVAPPPPPRRRAPPPPPPPASAPPHLFAGAEKKQPPRLPPPLPMMSLKTHKQ